MGKYDAILDELPRSFGQEPEKQEKINAIKGKIREITNVLDVKELASKYGLIRAEEDELKKSVKYLGLERAAYEQLISVLYEAQEITHNKFTDGSSISVYYEPRAAVVNKLEFLEWCIENGYRNELTLQWQITNRITKERLLEGEEEPEGVVAAAVLKVRYAKPK